MEPHTGATILGASFDGELRTLADTLNTTPSATSSRPRNIWVFVDATVDIHLTKRLAELPIHKALESGLPTEGLGLWMAFRGMHPRTPCTSSTGVPLLQRRHWTNGQACQIPEHKPDSGAGTRMAGHHTPQPPTAHAHVPSVQLLPHWVPEDTPHTEGDKQYHYPTSFQQLATTLGDPANTDLLRGLKDSVCTPLYYAALPLHSPPAHVQRKTRLQLALKQLPLLTRHYPWYTLLSIPVPAG